MSASVTPARLRAVRRRRWATRLGVVLLPLLIVGSFLWATTGSGSRLHQTEAAVVNLDEGATFRGKPMLLGQQYAIELRNQSGDNFLWRYGVTLPEAEAGLASGRFSAAVVIPAGFSRVLTGTAQKAEQATLQVERSPISGVSDQMLVSRLSLAATHSLSSEVTRRYLADVFVSTAELGRSLSHTTNLAQDARSNAATLQGQAQSAQQASSRLGAGVTGAGAGAKQAVAAASRAASSGKQVVTTQAAVNGSAQGATTANRAQRQAITRAAAQAKGVAVQARKASTATSGVSHQADAAGVQGTAAKKGADAVASAAAANKAAAQGYANKVSAVVKQQADLSARLKQTAAQIKQYTDTTAKVTAAVAAAQKTLAGSSVPAPSAGPTATPTGAPSPVPTPELPPTQQQASTAPLPSGTATNGAADLTRVATQLDALAQQIDKALTTKTAGSTQADFDAVTKAARKNAADAAFVAQQSSLAVANNAAVVTSAQSVATSTQSALGDLDALAQAITARSNPGAVTVPDCPSTIGKGEPCRAWKQGYAAGAQAAGSPDLSSLTASVTAARQSVTNANAAAAEAKKSAQNTQRNLASVAGRSATLAKETSDNARLAAKLTVGANADVSSLKDASTQLTTIATQLRELAGAISTGDQSGAAVIQQQLRATLSSPEVSAAIKSLPAQANQVQAAASQAVDQAAKNQKALNGVDPAKGGAKALSGSAASVTSTSAAQAKVAQQLQDTLTQLNSGMATLSTAMTSLGTGATSLTTTTTTVSDGASTLASRVDQLNQTLTRLQRAAGQAANDSASATVRAQQLQQRISALQQASGVVTGRTSAVATTAQDQVTRTAGVAKQLASDKARLPSTDDTTRQQLTTAASTPITTASAGQFRNIGWVSMLVVLALWAGAMGLISVSVPVSAAARRSTASPWRLLVTEMGPAAGVTTVQAIGVSIIAQGVLHMDALRWLSVTGALVLTGVMFAAINHVLVAFARMWGRLVAVAFGLVTGAGIVTNAFPPAMDLLRRISPLSPPLDLLRSLMTGVPLPGTTTTLLVGWFAGGVLFSALAILRARNPEPVRVPTVHDQPVTS